MIDDTGMRFVNEYAAYGKRADAQGTRRAFLIFDSLAMRRFGGAPGSPIPPSPTKFTTAFDTKEACVEWLCTEVGGDRNKFRQRLVTTIADFEKPGEDTLRKSNKASNYNWVSLTEPPEMVRKVPTPPYYVIELSQGILDTVGECDTDGHGRCLNEKGKPIENLYAAGNAAAPLTDRSMYSSGGMTLGKALRDGFIIGSYLCDK